jgi:hypothetical protein
MSSSFVAVAVVSPTAMTFTSFAHFMSVAPSPIISASVSDTRRAFRTAIRCSGFGLTCLTLSLGMTTSK